MARENEASIGPIYKWRALVRRQAAVASFASVVVAPEPAVRVGTELYGAVITVDLAGGDAPVSITANAPPALVVLR